jgi:hypothetical protein
MLDQALYDALGTDDLGTIHQMGTQGGRFAYIPVGNTGVHYFYLGTRLLFSTFEGTSTEHFFTAIHLVERVSCSLSWEKM